MIEAVDVHSAIGNSGGYIGLFLGNITLRCTIYFGQHFKYNFWLENTVLNIIYTGYAVLQLPDLFTYFHRLLSKWVATAALRNEALRKSKSMDPLELIEAHDVV